MKRKTAKPEKHHRLQIIVPAELADACRAKAKANSETLGSLIRRAMADEIGKPQLAEMRSRGKPAKP